jgi:hypothetical protein
MCGACGWKEAVRVHMDRVHNDRLHMDRLHMKRVGHGRSADRLYATLMHGFPEP